MNLDFAKKKLQSFQPKPGKYQIRFVPNQFNKDFPITEITQHWGYKKYPLLALTNWNEQDPIVEFVQSLRKSKDPEDWNFAKKIQPTTQFFAPVVVRGEENMGVRWWGFGKGIYKELLSLVDDEDYGGDFSSITDGRDFTLEIIEDMVAGKKVNKVNSLRIKPKQTELSKSAEEITKWTTEQKDLKSLGKKHSYDELKGILEDFLGNKEENVETIDDTPVQEPVIIQESKTPIKKKKSDKFDELFETETPSDDLPF